MLRRLIKLELAIRQVLADQNQRDLLLFDQSKPPEKLVTALQFLEVATTIFGGKNIAHSSGCTSCEQSPGANG